MKLIFAILLFTFQLTAQDCGSWYVGSVDTTNWQSVDTMGEAKYQSRYWIESQWRLTKESLYKFKYAGNCRCGCKDDKVEFQYRFCTITGIRQIRHMTTKYIYEPPEKTRYQLAVERFRKKRQ